MSIKNVLGFLLLLEVLAGLLFAEFAVGADHLTEKDQEHPQKGPDFTDPHLYRLTKEEEQDLLYGMAGYCPDIFGGDVHDRFSAANLRKVSMDPDNLMPEGLNAAQNYEFVQRRAARALKNRAITLKELGKHLAETPPSSPKLAKRKRAQNKQDASKSSSNKILNLKKMRSIETESERVQVDNVFVSRIVDKLLTEYITYNPSDDSKYKKWSQSTFRELANPLVNFLLKKQDEVISTLDFTEFIMDSEQSRGRYSGLNSARANYALPVVRFLVDKMYLCKKGKGSNVRYAATEALKELLLIVDG